MKSSNVLLLEVSIPEKTITTTGKNLSNLKITGKGKIKHPKESFGRIRINIFAQAGEGGIQYTACKYTISRWFDHWHFKDYLYQLLWKL